MRERVKVIMSTKTTVNKSILEIATERGMKSEGDQISSAIQGMKTLELGTLVDQIVDKEKEKGEISDFEAGLREVAKGKLQDLRAQNELREKGMIS